MGVVELYNYDSQNIQQLEVGLVTQQDVNALTNGTYTYEEGKTLSVSVSSASGHKQITCTANWGFELSDLDYILHDALGIRCAGVYHFICGHYSRAFAQLKYIMLTPAPEQCNLSIRKAYPFDDYEP